MSFTGPHVLAGWKDELPLPPRVKLGPRWTGTAPIVWEAEGHGPGYPAPGTVRMAHEEGSTWMREPLDPAMHVRYASATPRPPGLEWMHTVPRDAMEPRATISMASVSADLHHMVHIFEEAQERGPGMLDAVDMAHQWDMPYDDGVPLPAYRVRETRRERMWLRNHFITCALQRWSYLGFNLVVRPTWVAPGGAGETIFCPEECLVLSMDPASLDRACPAMWGPYKVAATAASGKPLPGGRKWARKAAKARQCEQERRDRIQDHILNAGHWARDLLLNAQAALAQALLERQEGKDENANLVAECMRAVAEIERLIAAAHQHWGEVQDLNRAAAVLQGKLDRARTGSEGPMVPKADCDALVAKAVRLQALVDAFQADNLQRYEAQQGAWREGCPAPFPKAGTLAALAEDNRVLTIAVKKLLHECLSLKTLGGSTQLAEFLLLATHHPKWLQAALSDVGEDLVQKWRDTTYAQPPVRTCRDVRVPTDWPIGLVNPGQPTSSSHLPTGLPPPLAPIGWLRHHSGEAVTDAEAMGVEATTAQIRAGMRDYPPLLDDLGVTRPIRRRRLQPNATPGVPVDPVDVPIPQGQAGGGSPLGTQPTPSSEECGTHSAGQTEQAAPALSTRSTRGDKRRAEQAVPEEPAARARREKALADLQAAAGARQLKQAVQAAQAAQAQAAQVAQAQAAEAAQAILDEAARRTRLIQELACKAHQDRRNALLAQEKALKAEMSALDRAYPVAPAPHPVPIVRPMPQAVPAPVPAKRPAPSFTGSTTSSGDSGVEGTSGATVTMDGNAPGSSGQVNEAEGHVLGSAAHTAEVWDAGPSMRRRLKVQGKVHPQPAVRRVAVELGAITRVYEEVSVAVGQDRRWRVQRSGNALQHHAAWRDIHLTPEFTDWLQRYNLLRHKAYPAAYFAPHDSQEYQQYRAATAGSRDDVNAARSAARAAIRDAGAVASEQPESKRQKRRRRLLESGLNKKPRK